MGAYERITESIYADEEIENVPLPDPLIEGVVDMNSCAAIYGRAGVGKSAVMQGMALCVATGQDWYGHPVLQGDVLYVVAEGQFGMGVRQLAWKKYTETTTVSGISYMTVAPNLMQTEDRLAIMRVVAERQPVFTILDTLARHVPGGDENTGPVMSLVVETLEGIKRASGGCASVVHHTGWGDGARLRGHSSLEGGIDHAIAILPHDPKTQDGRLRVYAQKHKHHPDHQTILRMKLEEIGNAVVAVEDRTLSAGEGEILDVLSQLAVRQNGSSPNGVSSHEWETACKTSRASFYRYRTKLERVGEVENKGGFWRCLNPSQASQ